MAEKDLMSYLLQRYLDDQLTAPEQESLLALLKKYPDDSRWAPMLQEMGLQQPGDPDYDETRWKPVVETILRDHVPKQERHDARPGLLRRMPGRRWWAVAAVLLLMLISGLYWRQAMRTGVAARSTKSRDFLPGGNRAVLTLSDGRRIGLDSASDGFLTRDGNSQVQKSGNSQLIYTTDGDKEEKTVSFNTLSTPRGGQYQLLLPDGTQVWLNAASSITFPTNFAGAERMVKMTGEVYFDVAKDKTHPFKVVVAADDGKDMQVAVLGTQFNVNAYADEPGRTVTLLEGGVRVEQGSQTVQLLPGAQARQGQDGKLVRMESANVEAAVAWKNGWFFFKDADVPTVMRQLSRWYNVEVEYEGTIPSRLFNGEIGRSLTLNQVMEGLSENKVKYKIINNKIVVQP